MFTSIVQYFYPDIKKEEIKKITLLGLAFLFTVGAYWLLRLLKDLVIADFAFPAEWWGANYGLNIMYPHLKRISPLVVFGVVLIYTKLIDLFKKHQLFYILISAYASIFTAISISLFLQNSFGNAFVGKTILATTGYVSYLFAESFGSLIVALFWSFTVSSTKSDQAKRCFPFIIALGQLGAIFGSATLLINVPAWILYCLVVILLLCIMLSIKTLIKTVPAHELQSEYKDHNQKQDFFGGIKLLLTQPYLRGVLIVSTFYEVAVTIVDYTMKYQAKTIYPIHFQWFLGTFGIATNSLAFIMALLGTSYAMKRFGIRICLLIYPIMFALALIGLYGLYFHLSSAYFIMWITVIVMMIVKATSYAVNNPVKEMMYIPTSKDAKFKSKGIIDMLGNRSAKMAGATINQKLIVAGSTIATTHNLIVTGSLINLGIIFAWLLAAVYVGNKNKLLVDSGEIVE